MKILCVGADSQVGAALIRTLRERGHAVIGTTRRAQTVATVADERIYLDLGEPPESWPGMPQVDAAVLCAAITGLDQCEKDPEETARVNVDHTVALARQIAERGVHVVYVSTTGVFDFQEPYRRHDSPPCPVTVYGRQKAEAENRILNFGKDAAVVRLTKVMTAKMRLLRRWAGELASHNPITAFYDTTIAPITADFSARMIYEVLDRRASGIIHASGDEDIPYTVLAEHLAKAMRVHTRMIKATRGTVPGQTSGDTSRYTTLDMSHERELFGITPPSSLATMQEVTRKIAKEYCTVNQDL